MPPPEALSMSLGVFWRMARGGGTKGRFKICLLNAWNPPKNTPILNQSEGRGCLGEGRLGVPGQVWEFRFLLSCPLFPRENCSSGNVWETPGSPRHPSSRRSADSLGVPPWSLFCQKNCRDFEVSSFRILVFRGTFRPIWPNFDPVLTNSDLFWPGRPDLFSPIPTYSPGGPDLFSPISFYDKAPWTGHLRFCALPGNYSIPEAQIFANRRKPQIFAETADFCRNRFVPFSLSLLILPDSYRMKAQWGILTENESKTRSCPDLIWDKASLTCVAVGFSGCVARRFVSGADQIEVAKISYMRDSSCFFSYYFKNRARCCEVSIWAKFGPFRGYYLGQVGAIIWAK